MVTDNSNDLDRAYLDGKRAAMIELLTIIARELRDDPVGQLAALKTERLQAIQQLRDVCAEHGDNDWPDELHLADVIEKHLARHLDD